MGFKNFDTALAQQQNPLDCVPLASSVQNLYTISGYFCMSMLEFTDTPSQRTGNERSCVRLCLVVPDPPWTRVAWDTTLQGCTRAPGIIGMAAGSIGTKKPWAISLAKSATTFSSWSSADLWFPLWIAAWSSRAHLSSEVLHSMGQDAGQEQEVRMPAKEAGQGIDQTEFSSMRDRGSPVVIEDALQVEGVVPQDLRVVGDCLGIGAEFEGGVGRGLLVLVLDGVDFRD